MEPLENRSTGPKILLTEFDVGQIYVNKNIYIGN